VTQQRYVLTYPQHLTAPPDVPVIVALDMLEMDKLETVQILILVFGILVIPMRLVMISKPLQEIIHMGEIVFVMLVIMEMENADTALILMRVFHFHVTHMQIALIFHHQL